MMMVMVLLYMQRVMIALLMVMRMMVLIDENVDYDGNRDHADGWCAIGVPDDVRCMRGEVTWIMHDACVARED